VRIAGAAIHAASERSAAAAAAASAASASAAAPAAVSPLKLALTAAASGAVVHLCHTMNDASGTLDAKWRALEGAAAQGHAALFRATQASAQALGEYSGSEGLAGRTLWAHESTAQVLEQEDALRMQVFAQVYSELNASARRQAR